MRFHQNGEPAIAGNAVMIGQKAPQKIQMGLAPFRDALVIVAIRDGAAHHQQEGLCQRVGHPPRLTPVFDDGKMIEQRPKARLGSKIRCRKAHGGAPNQRNPTESDFSQVENHR